MSMAEAILGWVVPDAHDCAATAAKLRAAHPKLSDAELAQKVAHSAKRWALACGAASGLVANPVAMTPAAAADISLMLKAEGKMAGVIAALLDPTSLGDGDLFATDVLAVVFPVAISQALREVGVRAGQQATKSVIRRYFDREILQAIVKFAAKRLGLHITEKALVTKALPVVGALIGGAWNWAEMRLVGGRALAYHALQPAPTPST